ncbi:MAG: tetratricopeptide repeat protein [Senegalia sp. (in: firmicutes)]|uniref:tetratricopeptide repeat protein n=1 Tax=Senegalia sp. (in: firmicutes) TaxID=1924098 RepID=UPI003F95A7A9
MLDQNKILSSGEKIRSLRKLLKANQNDITKGNFNRSLLSYIENDKAPLSQKVSEVISKNINKIAKEKNIPLNITADYLLEDDITQVRKITSRLLDELSYIDNINSDIFIQKIDELKKFFKNYDVKDLELKFYNLLAGLYYQNKEYNNSYLSYLQALEACVLNKNNINCKIEILLNMSKCTISTKNYEETILIDKYALAILKINNIINNTFYKRAYFNLALSYKNLGQYEESLKMLEIIENENFSLTSKQKSNIYVLKGNCYLRMNQFKASEENYKNALKISIDNNVKDELWITYYNLSNIYFKTNKLDKSIFYGEKALNLKENDRDGDLTSTLILLSEIYMKNKNLTKAEEYILESIAILEKNNMNMELIIKAYTLLLQIYSIEDNYKKIEKLAKEIEKLFQYNMTELETSKTKELLIKTGYYFMERDFYKAKLFINKGLNM